VIDWLLTRPASSRVESVLAIGGSPRPTLPVDGRVSEATSLDGAPGGRFDLVVAAGAVERTPRWRRPGGLFTLVEAVADGGMLLVVAVAADPIGDPSMIESPQSWAGLRPEELHPLTQLGLVIVSFEDLAPVPAGSAEHRWLRVTYRRFSRDRR
jgi:hypothetical protein